MNIHRVSDDMLSQNPAQNSPQRRLLEPFTVLHSVSHIKIAGPVSERYGASIAAQVSSLGPTLTGYLDQVTEVTQKGHGSFYKRDFKDAIHSYEMAYSLFISTCLRPEAMETNWTGLHPGLDQSIFCLYVILLCNRTFADYDASIWARDAAQHSPRGNSPERQSSYAKLVYIEAIASARLGKRELAVEQLCDGLSNVSIDVYKEVRLVDLRHTARSLLEGLGGLQMLEAMGFHGLSRNSKEVKMHGGPD